MAFVQPCMMWIEGRDQAGYICWCHRPTGLITYANPSRAGLSTVPNPNGIQCVTFFPSQESVVDPWEEYTDDKTKKKYWYNNITKKSTWINPKATGNKTPPPPPPPPPPSTTPKESTTSKQDSTTKKESASKDSKPKEPKVEIREQDLWSRVDDGEGGTIWFNKKTKQRQHARPRCLKKYPDIPRRSK